MKKQKANPNNKRMPEKKHGKFSAARRLLSLILALILLAASIWVMYPDILEKARKTANCETRSAEETQIGTDEAQAASPGVSGQPKVENVSNASLGKADPDNGGTTNKIDKAIDGLAGGLSATVDKAGNFANKTIDDAVNFVNTTGAEKRDEYYARIGINKSELGFENFPMYGDLNETGSKYPGFYGVENILEECKPYIKGEATELPGLGSLVKNLYDLNSKEAFWQAVHCMRHM